LRKIILLSIFIAGLFFLNMLLNYIDNSQKTDRFRPIETILEKVDPEKEGIYKALIKGS